jgi:hypothetical protein
MNSTAGDRTNKNNDTTMNYPYLFDAESPNFNSNNEELDF